MIDLALLETIQAKCAGRVRYKLGGKAPSLTADTSEIKSIDCSGWVRYLLARASNQAIKMPDGSQVQLDWVRAQGWRKLDMYQDVNFARADPSRLFIAFLSPKPGFAWPRHVWCLHSDGTRMRTLESHGSGGVNSRPWDTPNLRSCRACFEVPVD